jgi:hypothetical protein
VVTDEAGAAATTLVVGPHAVVLVQAGVPAAPAVVHLVGPAGSGGAADRGGVVFRID